MYERDDRECPSQRVPPHPSSMVEGRSSDLSGLIHLTILVSHDEGLAIVTWAMRMRCLALSAVLGTLAAGPLPAQTEYPLSRDSERHAGVPAGAVSAHEIRSEVFPGTVRDYWVYVPAQYRPDTKAAVMVFQDGGGFVEEDGRWRVPVVFDNLIHEGEMPVTVGIFVDPGVLPGGEGGEPIRWNRSFEYDALGDRYARFLLEELLPEVGRELSLTDDPNLRAIGGSSSGAICAFTVAWNRPDAFRRVLSFIGSYTNLRGGEIYPSLIRKTEPKPLRVFLQDGRRDLNLYAGDWWIANQDMTSALQYAGYDTAFVTGDQGHNSVHGSAVLPDALRWLWRDWTTPIAASTGRKGTDRHYATEILDPDHGWEVVSEGHQFTEGPAVNARGDVYFTDLRTSRIYRIHHGTGSVELFVEDSGGTNGLMFGPDGRLYGCQYGKKRIVAWDPDGTETVVAEGVGSNDIAIGAKGGIWFTSPGQKQVRFIDREGHQRVVHEGIGYPNGIVLSPDQKLLAVADYSSKWVWSFSVEPDGSLRNGQPFYRLETPDDPLDAAADGMTFDSEGYLYVATNGGIQVCDQAGRVTAIIGKPQPSALANVVFGGPLLDTLYVTAEDKVYRRVVRRRGVFPWRILTLPRPRL
jgi:gluconolactonase